MRVDDAKVLLSRLLFNPEKWDAGTVRRLYPDLVEQTQAVVGEVETVYRVLCLRDVTEAIEPHKASSCSRSLASCIDIADQMPSVVFAGGAMARLDRHFLAFRVSGDRVLLDVEQVVLPALADKLKNVTNHRIVGKGRELVRVGDALQLIEQAGEQELVVDLEGIRPRCRAKVVPSVEGKRMLAAASAELLGQHDKFVGPEEAKQAKTWLRRFDVGESSRAEPALA
ncbi:hypothetical protein [Ferrimonas marina]|uniref:Uncharacterized protein n=1 Tax=Ferrimonas marina TaxID=299255 RepID=A0A1M5TMK4_9GAMM|nr:hypothetical protein [Ferrimonas marina]SHH51918.1 hypothetical protein SAMN02745129_2204 [Ferrimonas marina]